VSRSRAAITAYTAAEIATRRADRADERITELEDALRRAQSATERLTRERDDALAEAARYEDAFDAAREQLATERRQVRLTIEGMRRDLEAAKRPWRAVWAWFAGLCR